LEKGTVRGSKGGGRFGILKKKKGKDINIEKRTIGKCDRVFGKSNTPLGENPVFHEKGLDREVGGVLLTRGNRRGKVIVKSLVRN